MSEYERTQTESNASQAVVESTDAQASEGTSVSTDSTVGAVVNGAHAVIAEDSAGATAQPMAGKESASGEAESAAGEAEEAEEEVEFGDFLEGLPYVNWGALFMPPIWGPVHGAWITILYYPALLLMDNLIYGFYTNPHPLTGVLSALAVLILIVITIMFARAAQGSAYQQALMKGKTKEQYVHTQKIWAVAMFIVLVVALAAASYYNIVVRPTVG